MKRSQYAVIGLGRFGSSLAKELIKLGYEVMGIDKDEEAVEAMSEELTHVVVADSTDEEVIRSLGLRNFDCVIVAIGDDIQSSILTTILLKDIGVKMVVAKALSELHGKVLNKIGVDRIIFPERDMGIRVAHQLVSPNLLDYIELSSEYTIAELTVPRCLDGRTLKDLDTRAKYGCSIVAINKKEGVIIAPTATDSVEEKDVMVVIGTNDQIDHFEKAVIR
ncbi:trk system potassium uptake protein TrkA [Paenibacillus sp. UNCCL117]|uniref:potassium channel family protein n=1 Tax=unclassified Paenibacillus TaxID=185978 RepID=UPI00088DBBF9|nr:MULTISPECIES: TrkA family potassium uptake protein [unclassified Paenibacillus]SDE04347.1 trk system potassium uptake protein TrkA [Paenibacillus sp. cl123]SFW57621.1 trk system potassium uptake protein TrkA [Paenibacillus sp. UNCCL117]